MINIKKKFFFIIKSVFALVAFLTLVLFFYAAFFFDPSSIKKKTVKTIEKKTEEILKKEERLKEEERLKKEAEQELQERTKIKKLKTTLKDGLFATVGNKAITRSDITNEMKSFLILNNMSYSEDKREELQQTAVKAVIKRTTKEHEIDKYDMLKFNQSDLDINLNTLASNAKMDLDTLKRICDFNGLDFSVIENQIKTELLWNSLIFYLYSNRISINLSEIDEQLKSSQNTIEFREYLISEIILKRVEEDKILSRVEEAKKKIKIEGFEKAAMDLSISQTAAKGGDLGWISENLISKKFKPIILNTAVGNISKPILLENGILIFKVRNKRKLKKEINLEELKNKLVNDEKMKILNVYSMTHYDNLRRTIAIKFFNE